MTGNRPRRTIVAVNVGGYTLLVQGGVRLAKLHHRRLPYQAWRVQVSEKVRPLIAPTAYAWLELKGPFYVHRADHARNLERIGFEVEDLGL